MTGVVHSLVNYSGEMKTRPRFYANDHSRDVLNLDPRTIRIEDLRGQGRPASLETEGFTLVSHPTAVGNFRDPEEIKRVHYPEIQDLLLRLSGADRVVVTAPGVLRFSETSPDSGRLNNSRPARFIHIDVSDATGAAFSERARPVDMPRPARGAVQRLARAPLVLLLEHAPGRSAGVQNP